MHAAGRYRDGHNRRGLRNFACRKGWLAVGKGCRTGALSRPPTVKFLVAGLSMSL